MTPPDADKGRDNVGRPREFDGRRSAPREAPGAAPELLVQPRESALTRISDPVRVPIGSKLTLCVLAVCSHALLDDDDSPPPTIVSVPLHKWIDGSKRPRGCAVCGEVLRRMKARPVCLQSTVRTITPFWK